MLLMQEIGKRLMGAKIYLLNDLIFLPWYHSHGGNHMSKQCRFKISRRDLEGEMSATKPNRLQSALFRSTEWAIKRFSP